MATLIKYIYRMPIEFQILAIRGIVKPNPTYATLPAIKEWMSVSSTEVL